MFPKLSYDGNNHEKLLANQKIINKTEIENEKQCKNKVILNKMKNSSIKMNVSFYDDDYGLCGNNWEVRLLGSIGFDGTPTGEIEVECKTGGDFACPLSQPFCDAIEVFE
jgi:hypothetical protein